VNIWSDLESVDKSYQFDIHSEQNSDWMLRDIMLKYIRTLRLAGGKRMADSVFTSWFRADVVSFLLMRAALSIHKKLHHKKLHQPTATKWSVDGQQILTCLFLSLQLQSFMMR